MDMEDMGGGEDGSEAESPKLGVKRNYTMDDLDAAVTVNALSAPGEQPSLIISGNPQRSTGHPKGVRGVRNPTVDAAQQNIQIGGGGGQRRRILQKTPADRICTAQKGTEVRRKGGGRSTVRKEKGRGEYGRRGQYTSAGNGDYSR